MKLRIALLSPSFPPVRFAGGIGSSQYSLFKALKERENIEIKTFTFADTTPADNTEEVYRICMKQRLNQAVSYWLKFRFRRETKLQRFPFQWYMNVLGSIYGKRLYKPVLDYKPDIVITPDKGVPMLKWGDNQPFKIVYIAHHLPLRFAGKALITDHTKEDSLRAVNLDKKIVARIDALVAPSPHALKVACDTYNYKGRSLAIPNLLDGTVLKETPKANLHKQFNLSEDTPIIYMPSVLNKRNKGSDLAGEIIRRLCANYKKPLAFFLNGSVSQYMKELLEYMPDNFIPIQLGQVPYLDNIANLKACDLCISPTLAETFGMVLLEAALVGMPIVAFNAGGNVELIKEDKTGYIVPFMDIESLIQKSSDLLLDKQKRQSMGSYAKDWASEQFDYNKTVQMYIDLFYNLMNR